MAVRGRCRTQVVGSACPSAMCRMRRGPGG